MKKEKKIKFDLYDVLCLVFISSLVFFVLGIILIALSYISRTIEVYEEKKCVEYFVQYDYILNECEIYRDKLEG